MRRLRVRVSSGDSWLHYKGSLKKIKLLGLHIWCTIWTCQQAVPISFNINSWSCPSRTALTTATLRSSTWCAAPRRSCSDRTTTWTKSHLSTRKATSKDNFHTHTNKVKDNIWRLLHCYLMKKENPSINKYITSPQHVHWKEQIFLKGNNNLLLWGQSAKLSILSKFLWPTNDLSVKLSWQHCLTTFVR